MNRIPIPSISPGFARYMRAAAASVWPHARRRARRSGAVGRQEVRERAKRSSNASTARTRVNCKRPMDELHQRPRAVADRAAEEVGRRRPEHAPGRDGEALVAPALRPRDRLRPLRLQVRAGRAVEERRLELAPAALEVDPRELGTSLSRIARDRRDRRAKVVVRAGRVVAADALLGGAAEEQAFVVEVRVRAGRRVHDRMGAVDEVELVVAPARLLRSLVLAVADLGRSLRERIARGCRVEVELDHLPVAFVQVVPVVVDVEEPVLQGELPRVARDRSRRARTPSAACPSVMRRAHRS